MQAPDTQSIKGGKIETGNKPMEEQNKLMAMALLLTYSVFFDPHCGQISFLFTGDMPYVV